MCGRFSLVDGTDEVFKDEYGHRRVTAEFETAWSAKRPLYNIAPSFDLPVIFDSYEHHDNIFGIARWGFEGGWNLKKSHPFANARLDTIRVRPTFREAFSNRHCLVPASSFFEWQREKGIKQPYVIKLKEQKLFSMAGIWEPPLREGGAPTFAILTTESNTMMSKIHDRMPIILEKKDEDVWLTAHGDGELPFNPQYPSEKMEMYPVTTKVNKVAFNEPEALEPIEEPTLGL